MENDSFDGAFGESDSKPADLKKKAAEQSIRSAEQAPEDTSRSALHYGEDHGGETSPDTLPDTATREYEVPVSSGQVTEADLSAPASPSEAGSSGQKAAIAGAPTDSPADARPVEEAPMVRTGDREGPPADAVDTRSLVHEAEQGPDQARQPDTPKGAALGQAGDLSDPSTQTLEAPGNRPPTDITLSNQAIAGNAEGAVVGKLSVWDQDAGDSHEFKLSDERFEVVDGQVKLKDGISLDHEEAAGLTLEVIAIDSGGAAHSESFEIKVVDMPDVQIDAGFRASYFDVDHKLDRLDQIDWDSEPTHEELVGEINYENGRGSFWEDGATDTFGTRITGNIEVEEGGIFNFHVGGDDGVVLFIDGKEVVENDGLHGFRTRSGEVELDAGTHVIEVRYFENYGYAGLKVEWEGPGLDGRELLTTPGVDDLQTVNGVPLALNIETSAMDMDSGNASQMIEGLPPGTVIEAGDKVATVDDRGSADITDWDASMLTVTPPVDFTGRVDAQITTKVVLENGDEAVSSVDMAFDVEAANVTPPDIDMQAGFRVSYFDVDHELSRLDQIDWDGEPTHEEVVGEVNYANGRDSFWKGGSKDTFGARITGEITVEEGGTFDFIVGGDDGVVLFVNGVEVVDDDGLHSYRTRSGEIELEPGTHEVELRYFENYGYAGLKLEWEGPGIDGRELVHADADLAVPENGALDIQLVNSDVGPDGSVSITGLPADTLLVSGENTAISDGSEIDLSGWNLDLVEFMPPPGFEGTISAEVTVSDTAFNGEQVKTTEVFEIDVGNPEVGMQTEQDDDEIYFALADGAENNNQGWADEPSDRIGDEDNESSDNDVMQESVVEPHGAEQSHEVTETYERSDW